MTRPELIKKGFMALQLPKGSQAHTVILDDSAMVWPVSLQDNIVNIAGPERMGPLGTKGLTHNMYLNGTDGGVVGRQMLLTLVTLACKAGGGSRFSAASSTLNSSLGTAHGGGVAAARCASQMGPLGTGPRTAPAKRLGSLAESAPVVLPSGLVGGLVHADGMGPTAEGKGGVRRGRGVGVHKMPASHGSGYNYAHQRRISGGSHSLYR